MRVQRGLLVAALATVSLVLPTIASSGLQPTGDGALHVDLASQVASNLSLATEPASHYPPLYHLLGGGFYAAAGVAGLRLLSALSFAAVSVMTYLLARQLGMSFPKALAAQALVSLSPVMLWYSGLILMETTLVATVMVSLLMALRYTDRPGLARGAALVLAMSAMLLVKQTAVPVAAAIVVYVALVHGGGLKRSVAVSAATLPLVAAPYLWVYENTGAFIDLGQPSVTDARNFTGSFPGSLIAGGWLDHQPDWSIDLEQDVNGPALYERGTELHEQRHIWLGNLFSWTRFTWLNSLYSASFSGYDLGQVWPTTIFVAVGLVLGIIAFPSAVRRHPEWLLVALVLVFSYIAMYFGSDTKRLFLFVTALSAPLVVLGCTSAWAWAMRHTTHAPWLNRQALALSAGVSVLLMLAAVPQLRAQFDALGDRESTQGGGFPSVGGVESIAEVGQWLEANSGPQEGFVAASVYEWEYYSNRPDLWDDGLDYRLYFLPPDLIREYLLRAGAKYVVVRANQIVPDDEWNHLELVPQSFVTAVEEMFPLAHESLSTDIRVYEVNA